MSERAKRAEECPEITVFRIRVVTVRRADGHGGSGFGKPSVTLLISLVSKRRGERCVGEGALGGNARYRNDSPLARGGTRK